ncbi:aminopeptidase N [Egicoccus halophilus]|uniref:Aminopeptidase N n=1 Tax=Egicoccus halophilus TaxID=1670830 RepID=A0A8J3A8P7_9ACTN|nr:aminopeptidase N [Egicoccus halophilus]GGI04621.1 aminopeptidase N [Egicoccus halophilus]
MSRDDTSPADTGAVRENLTRDEARQRAARVRDVRTVVHLDLTTGSESFAATSRLSFRTTEDGGTFVDCTATTVHRVELDGEVLPHEVVEATRIRLPGLHAGEHELTVVATMAYRHEGKGLHRFVDPSDDRVYLHSQFEPFDAHLVYACFDQPDLKTTFALTVDAPEEWVVVSNGRAIERPTEGAAGRWVFEPTPRISTYITAVVAGSYARFADEHHGRELGLYVRRSLADHLDTPEIFEVTKQGLDYFEDVFATPYPFGKYDQLFVPEFSAGAMENPGAITFSEVYVFRSKVTDANRERRAETILHEMAHMWFGDLVTMRWWDDLWLNESFATFMSVLAQADATRWRNAWVTFLDAEKAWAKMQDQLPSTHPVADEMPDVESVHQNFDGITYAKGASVLRQLVAWVGQDEFLAGVRNYFDRHAWGNTDLGDFLGALEDASGRDLAAWRDEWLLTTGVNTLTPEVRLADDGTYAEVTLVQTAPAPTWAGLPGVPAREPVLRRHRVAVGVYRRTEAGLVRDQRVELDVEGERTPVPELVGIPAGEVVLVNDDDLTYAKVELDAASTDVLTRELHALVEPLPRALVWSSTWDMVRDGRLPARSYVDLVVSNVASETEVGVLQRLLLRAVGAAERYADPGMRVELLRRLTLHARAWLADLAPGSDHQLAVVRHWAATARSDADQLTAVQQLLDDELTVEGLELDTDLRWLLVTALARAGVVDEERIAAELARDDTDLGRRQAATARAIRPDADAKEHAWQQLLEDSSLSHTVSRQIWGGFSQLDQGDVLASFVSRYFDALGPVWRERSLDWALEFSEGMFPQWAASPDLVDQVDATLADDDLPRPLRRVLLEQRDTLVRTLDARACDAAVG